MRFDKSISSVMTISPIAVFEEEKISEIERIFKEHPFHHLPVIKEGSKVVGIISIVHGAFVISRQQDDPFFYLLEDSLLSLYVCFFAEHL